MVEGCSKVGPLKLCGCLGVDWQETIHCTQVTVNLDVLALFRWLYQARYVLIVAGFLLDVLGAFGKKIAMRSELFS
jgi:hypothetical protein